MKSNYLDAHARHWEDAESLSGLGRMPNADHLYGLAAECGLKAVMLSLGMKVDKAGKPTERAHLVHINRLWGEFLTFATGRAAVPYVSLLGPQNPFSDWDIGQRYAHRSNFGNNRIVAHKAGCSMVKRMVGRARKDGRL